MALPARPRLLIQYLEPSPAVEAIEPSAARDHAISGLVQRTRWENPQAAITWASEIEHPQRREAALVNAGQAYMRRDQDAAREWLSGSGLSEQAQKMIIGGN